MSNLLPLKDKRMISAEFFLRLFVVFLSFTFIIIIIAFLLFLPSYFLSLERKNNFVREDNILSKSESLKDQENLNIFLQRERDKMEVLSSPENTDDFIMDAILSSVDVKPSDIKIRGFYYDAKEEDEDYSIIVLRGVSSKRESLIKFSELLEKERLFDRVDLPISDLIENEDIDFSIKIYLKRL